MGMGNKIVLKGFERMPMVSTEGTSMTVTAGDFCSTVTTGGETKAPTGTGPTSSATRLLGLTLPLLFGKTGTVLGSNIALAMASGFLGNALMASAQTTSECELAPIEVNIYVDASSDEIVMRSSQSGDFEICPPESKSNCATEHPVVVWDHCSLKSLRTPFRLVLEASS